MNIFASVSKCTDIEVFIEYLNEWIIHIKYTERRMRGNERGLQTEADNNRRNKRQV